MPKRKRSNDDPVSSLSPLASHLYHHLTNSITSFHASLKLARGFERQKLGRRLKSASGEDKSRLNNEVAVLKKLDLTEIAEGYLWKLLGRVKRVKEHEAFKECEKVRNREENKPEGNNVASGQERAEKEEMNIKGRLFKSAPVMKSRDECLQAVYEILNLNGTEKKTIRRHNIDNHASTPDVPMKESKQSMTPNSDSEAEEPILASKKNTSHNDTSKAAIFTSDPHQPRLVSPSLSPNLSPSRSSSAAPSISVSPSPSPALSSNPSLSLSLSTSPPPLTNPTSSFLPSLSLQHGYISGSDSDSDSASSLIDPPRRKNRLGQKQRQAIAERKYGREANHLKQQQQQRGQRDGRSRNRDEGWDARAGAVEGDRRGYTRGSGRGGRGAAGGRGRGTVRGRYGFGSGYGRGGSGGGASGPNSDPVQASRFTNNRSSGGAERQPDSASAKPLHPSWAAAQKRVSGGSGGGAKVFQGKKITFD